MGTPKTGRSPSPAGSAPWALSTAPSESAGSAAGSAAGSSVLRRTFRSPSIAFSMSATAARRLDALARLAMEDAASWRLRTAAAAAGTASGRPGAASSALGRAMDSGPRGGICPCAEGVDGSGGAEVRGFGGRGGGGGGGGGKGGGRRECGCGGGCGGGGGGGGSRLTLRLAALQVREKPARERASAAAAAATAAAVSTVGNALMAVAADDAAA